MLKLCWYNRLKPNARYKHYQELFFVFNFQALFAISLYSQERAYLINKMITLAAVHLLFITTYHIAYYMCGGVMRNRIIPNIFIVVTRRFSGLLKSGQDNRQVIDIQSTRLLNIPEVTYTYQEPLIGVDSNL